MSISLPTNRLQKKVRYWLLVLQGSITIAQAKTEYKRYLRWGK